MSNNPDDLVPITEFLLESETNLAVAKAIYDQYENAVGVLIAAFFEKVKSELRVGREDWSFECGKFLVDQYAGFMLSKPSWKDCYTVRLEASGWGTRMIYGVWRREDRIGGVERNAKLLGMVRESFPSAKSRRWYEAEVLMTSPASDWSKPEVLWRMHTDKNFLKEVVALLLQVIALAEIQLDAMAMKLP